jgi:ribosomal protein L40E
MVKRDKPSEDRGDAPASHRSEDDMKTCPWCSATVPVEAESCPSCGASLGDAPEGDLPGLTQIDPAAVTRTRRIKVPKLAAFLGVGDGPDATESTGKVEPPTEAVRQEMLRLELAALKAELDMKASQAAAQQALPPDDEAGKAEPG